MLTVLLFFLGGPALPEKQNTQLQNAGAADTSIVFDNITFRPANALEQFVFTSFARPEYKKYAVFRAAHNADRQVLIYCGEDPVYVLLSVGGKQFVYVNTACSLQMDSSMIQDMQIGSLNDITYVFEPGEPCCYDAFDYDYDENTKQLDQKDIAAFCAFYTQARKPVDKTITAQYMNVTTRPAAVTFEIALNGQTYLYTAVLGLLFSDQTDTVYFYDYTDANAYRTGKELSRFVRQ